MLAEEILTEEQKEIKEAAREFAEKEFPKYAEEFDKKKSFLSSFGKKRQNSDLLDCSFPKSTAEPGTE